ncbi:YkgJ family cysteine cluster protein [Fibrobacterota bacterium]
MTAKPWYRKGLRFECQRCGNCCGGAPGYVYVTKAEISALAVLLDVTDSQFISMYTNRLRNGRISLRDKADYDCIFYFKGKGCKVYSNRPRQCRTWPFWKMNTETRKKWEETAGNCPGINKGPLYLPKKYQQKALTPT